MAEDDAIIADGLSRSLRQGGCAVDWASNGLDADAALMTAAYDLLILDLGLPRLSGLDVLKRLRARDSALRTEYPRAWAVLRAGNRIRFCNRPEINRRTQGIW